MSGPTPAAVSVVLRHNAPPVERPDGPAADRLYAWVIESVLPLLHTLRGLTAEHGPVATAVITPLVAEMWADGGLIAGIERALEARLEAARRGDDPPERIRLEGLWTLWRQLGGDLNRAYAALADDGVLALATTPATDAALPLIGERAFARPQIAVAVASHTRRFGRPPTGIDLTRGYSPRIDLLCAEYGLRWCLVAGAAFERATAKPLYGPWAPLYCPKSGLAAFAVDPEVSGLPAGAEGLLHGALLDRALRSAPPSSHLALHPDDLGDHPPAGRSTRADVFAEPWDRDRAEAAAAAAGAEWLAARRRETEAAGAALGRPPHRVAAFDVALFGRWWAGGHGFLGAVLADPLMTTPDGWLEAHPVHQLAWPGLARDGADPGFSAAGDDPDREWMLDALPAAAERMTRVADRFVGTVPAVRRPAEDAARALLLAQCGDWPLMIEQGAAGVEAVDAVRALLLAFERAVKRADGGAERRDDPFGADPFGADPFGADPEAADPFADPSAATAVRIFEELDLKPFASW